MFFKKLTFYVFLSLSVLSVQAAQDDLSNLIKDLPEPILPFNDVSPTIGNGVGVFVATFAVCKCVEVACYFYYAREANLQKNNPTINNDVINNLKKMCLDKGVKINHVFYSPVKSELAVMRGGAAILTSACGNILMVGAGYGISTNEKDIIPLTLEEKKFIIGHECMHVLNFDGTKRHLVDSALSTGLILSKSAKVQGLCVTFGLLKLFGLSKFERHQEYDADYYASTDPKVVQNGINLWQTIADKEQYLDILTRMNLKIQHAFFSTHPSFQDRVDHLKLRLKELQQILNVSDKALTTVEQQEIPQAA